MTRKTYLDFVIIAGGYEHFVVPRVERHTVDHVPVLVLGQADTVVAVPEVRVHVLGTAGREDKIGLLKQYYSQT